MLKGFKEFLLRGNIVDLAVAVVIGTAFVALVTSFATYVINPILARAGGGAVGEGLGIQLGQDGVEETFINVGAIITAMVTFALTAVIVYFAVVAPMKRITERFAKSDRPAEVPADVALLTEIRDLLISQQR